MAGFKFIGGSLCLDFVNTVGGRAGRRVIRDKIAGDADLTAWGAMAGVLSSAQHRRVARSSADPGLVIERARVFREALYRVLLAVLRERRPPSRDVRLVGTEIAAARSNQRLVYSSGEFRWIAPAAEAGIERVLNAVAASAAELLTSPDLHRLGQCGGPQCGWLFLDTTRNGSRRWCDMQDCGNRAKVTRYRQKHARRLQGRGTSRVSEPRA